MLSASKQKVLSVFLQPLNLDDAAQPISRSFIQHSLFDRHLVGMILDYVAKPLYGEHSIAGLRSNRYVCCSFDNQDNLLVSGVEKGGIAIFCVAEGRIKDWIPTRAVCEYHYFCLLSGDLFAA
jgi:hypothetical protein